VLRAACAGRIALAATGSDMSPSEALETMRGKLRD
jgi:hypothetical protein